MRQDLRLRAAARAIFETVYPTEDWSPVPFDEAERHGTLHYRQAVDAARQAQLTFAGDAAAQLELGPL